MPSRVANFVVKAVVKSPLHPLLGKQVGVITVQGRKTGRPYSTPINVTKEDGHFTVISLRTRTWWRNLRGARPAELRTNGQALAVRGQLVEGEQAVSEGLAGYFQRHPEFAKYFKVRLGKDGRPEPKSLDQIARERVIIRLIPN